MSNENPGSSEENIVQSNRLIVQLAWTKSTSSTRNATKAAQSDGEGYIN